MEITWLGPPDDRVVVFGQSCVGKTTFAGLLSGHHYYCFDALFRWHDIETLGLSAAANLGHIAGLCTAPRFVLDGWHLSDRAGRLLPAGAAVYVVYAPYERVVAQYRVPVPHPEAHRPMFLKWYAGVDYPALPGVRYFRNLGATFAETPEAAFLTWLRECGHNPLH